MLGTTSFCLNIESQQGYFSVVFLGLMANACIHCQPQKNCFGENFISIILYIGTCGSV
uniref:Uncharacterized protein n=1 Tax=Rhizophora mucronata TaxID=61149 RepID=A0A2P2P429_RHIMU